MTSRIQREFAFQAGVYTEETFLMNIYDISICMNVETDIIREQLIAMERICYFMGECIDNCIFVQDTEKKVIEKYTAAGLKVCTTPVEPYDQMINVMLLTKLNAITEGRFDITDISLSSKLSDGVSYMHDCDSATGPFAVQGWWTDSASNITEICKQNKKDKIVHLFNARMDWSDLELSWKEKSTDVSEEITFEPIK